MSWRIILLPTAEDDLADDVQDAAMRARIEAALAAALADPLAHAIVEPATGTRVVSFYVAAARGPIIVYAAYAIRGEMILVRNLAFDDEGGSLGRLHPPRL